MTYNSQKCIVRCLKSISRFTSPFLKEVIIIDNNSTDRTIDNILETTTKLNITLIKNSKNEGFARASNKGIQRSRGEFVLLLNPDTELNKNSIAELLKHASEKKTGIVGGKMIGAGGRIHGSFVRYPSTLTGLFDFTNLRKLVPNNFWHKSFYYLDQPFPETSVVVDAVSGGYMLIKRKTIKSVGLLDEKFFMYLEDVDYCLRARQKGFRIIYCPTSIIFHQGGASSPNKDKINFKAWVNSRRYYFQKNLPLISNLLMQPIFIIDEVAMRIWRRIR